MPAPLLREHNTSVGLVGEYNNVGLPALRINLLPKRDFNANQDFKFSQLSFAQQQVIADGGSGVGSREKSAKAVVMSSIVLVA
jgi:hypothetical protein